MCSSLIKRRERTRSCGGPRSSCAARHRMATQQNFIGFRPSCSRTSPEEAGGGREAGVGARHANCSLPHPGAREARSCGRVTAPGVPSWRRRPAPHRARFLVVSSPRAVCHRRRSKCSEISLRCRAHNAYESELAHRHRGAREDAATRPGASCRAGTNSGRRRVSVTSATRIAASTVGATRRTRSMLIRGDQVGALAGPAAAPARKYSAQSTTASMMTGRSTRSPSRTALSSVSIVSRAGQGSEAGGGRREVHPSIGHTLAREASPPLGGVDQAEAVVVVDDGDEVDRSRRGSTSASVMPKPPSPMVQRTLRPG